MKSWLTLGLLFVLSSLIFAMEPPSGAESFDENGDGRPDRWEEFTGNDAVKVYSDENGDGLVDYVLEYSDVGFKIYEAMDFNEDGEIDDHYFYANDVLIRREVDSNYDGKVDIWVYLTEGVYVEKYERDTDFDGQIDLEKVFGEGE